jgi:hydroxymethylpyrimidine/phosphomethylpyrimidine kinase
MPRKKRNDRVPSALTIAGSDSGGGAGIQADLKTFAALGVHGTTALTCITAQNPKEVRSVQAVDVGVLKDQIEAVFAELPPAAIKTGMLFSAEIIEVVSDTLSRQRRVRLIVDPVMISTSGAQLLRDDAIKILEKKLLPRADLVTPNRDEAEFLLKRKLSDWEELRAAAREIHAHYGCAALVKGGHVPGPLAVDFFFDGKSELMLEAPRVKGISTHGTGCTYSAAIAAYCAQRESLVDAVILAKTFISNAIASSVRCRRHWVLNSFWR